MKVNLPFKNIELFPIHAFGSCNHLPSSLSILPEVTKSRPGQTFPSLRDQCWSNKLQNENIERQQTNWHPQRFKKLTRLVFLLFVCLANRFSEPCTVSGKSCTVNCKVRIFATTGAKQKMYRLDRTCSFSSQICSAASSNGSPGIGT